MPVPEREGKSGALEYEHKGSMHSLMVYASADVQVTMIAARRTILAQVNASEALAPECGRTPWSVRSEIEEKPAIICITDYVFRFSPRHVLPA